MRFGITEFGSDLVMFGLWFGSDFVMGGLWFGNGPCLGQTNSLE